MGRKTKYNPDTFPLLAEGYARDGLSDKQIAKNLNISKETYYTYQKKYLVFFDSIKKGKAPVDTEVENALLKRALGYEYEEVTTEVTVDEQGRKRKHKKVVKKSVIPDVGAQIFWLKNRKPNQWKDKREFNLLNDEDVDIDKRLKAIAEAVKGKWADE